MLITTEGIVLHTIKYGESSVISTIFTNDFGRQTYLINAARSKKSKNKASLLQPLFLVDLVAYQKQSHEIHRVKEIKSTLIYQNLPLDIVKSTMSIFLAEILYKSINEQESYPEMFDFIKNSLLYFDLMEEGFSCFHLWFLLRLTEYLGFLPEMKRIGFQNWFDMKKGEIVPVQPSHPFFANKEATEFLADLSVLKIHELSHYQIPRKMRDSLITTLVDYYQLHFENPGEIKSLKVLREVFK
jgi:DNA repair protein RecO (recombination protein O)